MINPTSLSVPILGVDDGHSGIKCAYRGEDGSVSTLYFHSRARPGASALAGLDGGVVAEIYETESERYTVGLDGTDTRTSDYPVSSMNRVLVAHGIHQSGISSSTLRLVTGLPLREWFQEGGRNETRIRDKITSMSKPVRAADGWVRPEIEDQRVVAEAVAAWVYGAESGKLPKDAPSAVVDIGGRTLDLAVILPGVDGRPRIDLSRSGSLEAGALMVRDVLRDRMLSHFHLDVIGGPLLDEAMTTGRVFLFGREEDVSELVAGAILDVRTMIRNACQKYIGKGADLRRVWLVGGGTRVIDLAGDWPHAVLADEPEFANAKGMLFMGEMAWNEGN